MCGRAVTWQQAGDEVDRLAAGLMALGIEPEQRVAIASTTRYEWILADLAVMCAGAATTTVYPTTNAEDVAYIVADSECRVVFAEDDDAGREAARDRKSELPHLAQGRHLRRQDRRRLGDRPSTSSAKLGDEYLADDPDASTSASTRSAGPPRHADLHVRHHRPAQGRAAARTTAGPTRARRSTPRTSSARTTCSTSGCRWPTRSARCCCRRSSQSASPPRSTAASTRSSRTSPS